MKRLFPFLIFFMVASCATVPPVVHDVQSEKTVDAGLEDVSGSVRAFLENEGIPVIDRENDPAAVIETEEIKVPYEGFLYESEYCDCGTLGGIYVYHEILGQISVLLEDAGDGGTSVTITPEYRASLWWDREFVGWVECQSKGYLESRLFDYLDALPERKQKNGPASEAEVKKGALPSLLK